MLRTRASAGGFDSYVASIEHMAQLVLEGREPTVGRDELSSVLDGQAALTLRDTVPLAQRRDEGLFFSGSVLRSIVRTADSGVDAQPVIDPALGAGDLLLEWARHLPAAGDLAVVIQQWGTWLNGCDVRPEFVRLAKARLVLSAYALGARRRRFDAPLHLDALFPGISVGDGLARLAGGWERGDIVMNPPFVARDAPGNLAWASGRTNLAAMFAATAVESAAEGVRLTAILPDVLRTGTRYAGWRMLMEGRLRDVAVTPFGRFDPWTDIDVFVLRGTVDDRPSPSAAVTWWARPAGTTLTVGDRFRVSVGSVVPHRHTATGTERPYIHARTVPLGGEFNVTDSERKRFKATPVNAPFVVVRRTSRPGDGTRGVGTVIVGTGEVLVENHLLVLSPKSGRVEDCRELAGYLSSEAARSWLNDRIRCRHLTTAALRDMPYEHPS